MHGGVGHFAAREEASKRRIVDRSKEMMIEKRRGKERREEEKRAFGVSEGIFVMLVAFHEGISIEHSYSLIL